MEKKFINNLLKKKNKLISEMPISLKSFSFKYNFNIGSKESV